MKLFFRSIPMLERALIARNLHVMLKSGIPVAESLLFALDQAKAASTKKVLKSIHNEVASGISFASSLDHHRQSFGSLWVNFIRVGEQSGTLEQSLDYIAEQYERDYELQKKISSAMIYPMIILGIVIVYAIVFVYGIFPRLEKLFASFTTNPLPAITRGLLSFTYAMRSWGWAVLLLIIIILFLFKIFSRSAFVTKIRDVVTRKTPGVKTITQQFHLARMFRMMALLQKSGMSLPEALTSAEDASSSPAAKKALKQIIDAIDQGKSIAKGMAASNFFPSMPIKLIEASEKSGSLEDTLFYLANYYERDIDYTTKSLSSTVEPILLIIVGFAVALLAIAIVVPIYQYTGSLRPF